MVKVDKAPYAGLVGQKVRVNVKDLYRFAAKLVDVRAQSVTALPYPPKKRTADTGKAYTPPVIAFEYEDHCPLCVVREDFTIVGVADGLALVFVDGTRITMQVLHETDF
jgi:hypothetical protein